MAAFFALKEAFIDMKIRGCFFYFTQILYRKIQKLVLTSYYMKYNAFRECFKMICSLAVVQIDKLKIEIEKLEIYINQKENLSEIKEFFQEFIDLYCKDVYKESKSGNIFSVSF
ncbi:hypothetical protein DMUE_1101 [Dictyocoela muelleri]|nr:hypothetical protein DMUE_1101 [Dictyocoela muelleri]